MDDYEGFARDIEELNKTKGTKKMSFLQIGDELNKHQDEHPVEGGEYLLRITSADIPDGKGYMLVRFEIVDDPYAKEISRFFNLPGSGRNPKEENRNLGLLKHFFSAFNIDPLGNYNVSEPEPEGFVGREGYATLSTPEDDGKGYGPQNRISKFTARA